MRNDRFWNKKRRNYRSVLKTFNVLLYVISVRVRQNLAVFGIFGILLFGSAAPTSSKQTRYTQPPVLAFVGVRI